MKAFFKSLGFATDQERYGSDASTIKRFQTINEGVQEFLLQTALSGQLKRIYEENQQNNQYRFFMNDATYEAAQNARGIEVVSREVQLSATGSLSLIGASVEIMSSDILGKIQPRHISAITKYAEHLKKIAEEEAAQEEQMATEVV